METRDMRKDREQKGRKTDSRRGKKQEEDKERTESCAATRKRESRGLGFRRRGNLSMGNQHREKQIERNTETERELTMVKER